MKYYKNGKLVSVKNSVAELPFEEITESFLAHRAEETEAALEDVNKIALLAYKRRVAAYNNSLSSGEGSNEQEHDGSADFEKVTSLDPDTALSIKNNASDAAVAAFADKYNIQETWSWLGPQLLAHLGRYSAPLEGEVKPLDFLRKNVCDDREKGIYRLVAGVPRGRVMKDHTNPEHLKFCAFVPAYMAAQKMYNNIPFTRWSLEGLDQLVDKDMYAALTAPALPPGVTNEELLEIRDLGLTYTSRAKATPGAKKKYNPATYHQLTGISNTCIGHLPKYAKAMVTQIWCAHPQNRHRYMLLDPYNWDNFPSPLIQMDIFRLPQDLGAKTASDAWDV